MTGNLLIINEFKQNQNVLNEARLLMKGGKYEEALGIACAAYKSNPESKDAIFTYAQALYLCGYERKATNLFEKIEDYEDPYYAGFGVYFYLADCYCMANYNLFKALKLISKAIKFNKENSKNYKNVLEVKGRILYAMGYYDKALSIFESLYKTIPSIMLEIYLSKTYFKKGNYLKGYLYFTKIFNHYEYVSANLNYEEIQCYLDMKLNEYSKECHMYVNEKIKQSIEEKLGTCKITTSDKKEDPRFYVPIAGVLSKFIRSLRIKRIK